MIIEKKKLLQNLKTCMPGIETGTAVLAGADSFIFHNNRIFSCNDSIAVSVPLDDTDEVLEGCIKADEFFKVVSKFSKEEINFVAKEKSWLLKCGKAKAEMTLLDFDFESRLKGITPDEKEDWIEVGDDFILGVAECRMPSNKTAMSGIFIDGNNVVSTDGFQINSYTIKNELPTFWINDNSVNELLKIKTIKELQLQDSWVHFRTAEGTVLSVRTLNTESFPIDKVKNIMKACQPKETDLHAEFPAELISAIDRASSFSMNVSEHSGVRLTISGEGIVVSSERTSGKYTEKVNWEKELPKEIDSINVYVDYAVISSMAKKSLEFYFLNSSGVPKMLFTSDSSFHLMMIFKGDN